MNEEKWIVSARRRLTRWADWQRSISGGRVFCPIVIDLDRVEGRECEIAMDAEIEETEKILAQMKFNRETKMIYRVIASNYLNDSEGGRTLADRLNMSHHQFKKLLSIGEAMVYAALRN